MVTDRKIIVEHERTKKEITKRPFFVENIEGFDALDVTIVTSQGYGQDGATVVNSYVGARPMTITGKMIAETTAKMQELRDTLLNLFAPKTNLTMTHTYGGITRRIDCMAEKTPSFGFTEVTKVQTFEVRLSAKFPFWKDEQKTIARGANWIGGMRFPLIIPKPNGMHFGVKSKSKIISVYNASPMTIGMEYEFTARGTVTNPGLFNVNTREHMKLLTTMDPGDSIKVESGEDKTVTGYLAAGEKKDLIGCVDIIGGGDTFLELEPGDNLFRYTADSGEGAMEVKISYLNLYHGV